jgi:hypothetical protein
MSMSISSVIHELVAPAILISANGLLCLALYNRLAAIVGRLRTFHNERLNLLIKLHHAEGADRNIMQTRFEDLSSMSGHIMRRGRLVRNAIVALLICVISMLACSAAIGFAMALPGLRWLGLALFGAGIAAAMTGMVYALRELAISLTQVEAEHESLDDIFTQSNEEIGA